MICVSLVDSDATYSELYDDVRLHIDNRSKYTTCLYHILFLVELPNYNNTLDNVFVTCLYHFQIQQSIRSILEKDKGKFQKVLYRKLGLAIVLTVPELNHMNRILTKHYFENQILNEKR